MNCLQASAHCDLGQGGAVDILSLGPVYIESICQGKTPQDALFISCIEMVQ